MFHSFWLHLLIMYDQCSSVELCAYFVCTLQFLLSHNSNEEEEEEETKKEKKENWYVCISARAFVLVRSDVCRLRLHRTGKLI